MQIFRVSDPIIEVVKFFRMALNVYSIESLVISAHFIAYVCIRRCMMRAITGIIISNRLPIRYGGSPLVIIIKVRILLFHYRNLGMGEPCIPIVGTL